MLSQIMVSVRAAAHLVQLPESALRAAIFCHALPACIVAGRIRVAVSDLRAWAAQRTIF